MNITHKALPLALSIGLLALGPAHAQPAAPATPAAPTVCYDPKDITVADGLATLREALDLSKVCEAELAKDPEIKAIAEAARNRPKKEPKVDGPAKTVTAEEAKEVSGDALIKSFTLVRDALRKVEVTPQGEPETMRNAAVKLAEQAILALEKGDGANEALTTAPWSLTLDEGQPIRVGLGVPPAQRDFITAKSFETCATNTPGSPCRENFDDALKISRLIRAVELYPLTELIRPDLVRLATEYKVREVMWQEYFFKTRVQYPWEMVINSRATFTMTQAAPEPPKYQWIIAHPDVAVEYVWDADDGEQLKPTLLAEVLGYNRWGGFDKTTGKINTAYGASAITTWTDRDGTKDLRYGLMLHYRSRYSLAFTTGGGETGVLISIALGEKVRTAKEDAKTVEDALKDEDYDAVCDIAGLGGICGK